MLAAASFSGDPAGGAAPPAAAWVPAAGERCDARCQASQLWQHQQWQTKWFPGVVVAVDEVNQTCDVHYDDGEYELEVGNRVASSRRRCRSESHREQRAQRRRV